MIIIAMYSYRSIITIVTIVIIITIVVIPADRMRSLVIMQMPTEMQIHANIVEYVKVILQSVLIELARLQAVVLF